MSLTEKCLLAKCPNSAMTAILMTENVSLLNCKDKGIYRVIIYLLFEDDSHP